MSKTLSKMRKGLKAADELELPMDPEFFNRLHNKIMAQVSETAIEPVSKFYRPRKFLKAHWREWIYPAGRTMAFVFAMTLLISQRSNQVKQHVSIPPLNHFKELMYTAVLKLPDVAFYKVKIGGNPLKNIPHNFFNY